MKAPHLKAAEDIIRCEGGFKDKSEVSVNVNVADMLKAARERATARQLPKAAEIIDVTPTGSVKGGAGQRWSNGKKISGILPGQ